ncbi:MAG: SpoIIE family protein phosphatase, partial [Oscillospiraceae bacterium]|nr:SpoIIE family protein phosphatase [Oscillospiraceae bacterium]
SSYSDLAFSYARTAAEYIDGDRVLPYLETLEEDAYYREVQEFLNITQRNTGLKYYYVFVPYDDDLVYVWDADNEDGACPLGYHEEYMEGGKETAEKVFRPDPPEEIGIYQDDTYGSIATAISPIFNSAGEPVALVGVDLSMPGIRQAILRFVLGVVCSVAVVTAVSMVVFHAVVRRQILLPVQRLNGAAKGMVGHLERDDAFRIDIRTGDEIQELAESFTQMDAELREYLLRLASVTAEKERIGAELNVATQIQADMLPRIFPPFPGRREFDIYASMTPAKEVGGDFYDFFLIDGDHLALVMADVSGKGVPAALFMVIAKTLIKNHAQMGEYSPAKVLTRVNEQLCEGNEAELFVTVWLAILEISTGRGLAANAGHEHPALCRAGGRYELVQYRHSPAVATLEGIRFREHEFALQPGDSLFVYTDGVPEATDARDELYGTERMIAALNRSPEAPPAEALAAVKGSVDAFVGEAPQFDDITMLCLRYFGGK